MRDIIEELCSGCFDTRFHASKEYLRQVKEDEPLWDQVAEVFGPEFVDELWSGISILGAEAERSMFRQGFHLGALLMLDLLYGPPQPV